MANSAKIIIGLILLAYLLKKGKKKLDQIKSNITKQEFINLIKPAAVQIGFQIGVPYEFIIAQIALETGYGKSELFRKYFNVGGVKAVKNQPYVVYDTIEYIKGIKTKIKAKFAKYNSIVDGLIGYSKILTNRYFNKYTNKTDDPKKYVDLLQSGLPKYATDINYTQKIKKLIDFNKQYLNN